jgi:hypothetical protein
VFSKDKNMDKSRMEFLASKLVPKISELIKSNQKSRMNLKSISRKISYKMSMILLKESKKKKKGSEIKRMKSEIRKRPPKSNIKWKNYGGVSNGYKMNSKRSSIYQSNSNSIISKKSGKPNDYRF